MPLRAIKMLVIEDDPQIRLFLRRVLDIHGATIIDAEDGQSGYRLIERENPDVVLLDLGLPDIDGLKLFESIRAKFTVPVIVMSARSDESTIVEALDMGVEDFVTKPFGVDELMARVRAAMRRKLVGEGREQIFKNRGLEVDLASRSVKRDGQEIRLSPKEYDLMKQLTLSAGKVLTHRQLMGAVWPGDTDIQYLRIYIRQIRQKIEPNPDQPSLIITEPGVGYRLMAE
jgi:two-component system, OmpR family, KDP operon response regulator KdpE